MDRQSVTECGQWRMHEEAGSRTRSFGRRRRTPFDADLPSVASSGMDVRRVLSRLHRNTAYFDRSKIDVITGLRCAVGIAIALAVGLATGQARPAAEDLDAGSDGPRQGGVSVAGARVLAA